MKKPSIAAAAAAAAVLALAGCVGAPLDEEQMRIVEVHPERGHTPPVLGVVVHPASEDWLMRTYGGVEGLAPQMDRACRDRYGAPRWAEYKTVTRYRTLTGRTGWYTRYSFLCRKGLRR